MMPIPRPYRDDQDLERMRGLLILGRQAANGTYYVHTGDLDWWLYFPLIQQSWNEIIYLRDGSNPDELLIGWALLSPEWRAFDVFVHPRERGSGRAAEMYIWAEEQITRLVKDSGGADIRTMWICEADEVLINHLLQRGFIRGEDNLNCFERSLAAPLPNFGMPAGFQIRSVAGEEEGLKRAMASHAAFSSDKSFEFYWSRYQRFMRSPGYSPDLNLMIVTPDGRCASFCNCWLDPVNRVGLFEPVGTHPDFQRLGMARAVMIEGLRRMQVAGMLTATVGAESDNPAAQGLYRSIGFQMVNKLCTYQKNLE